ncbi:bifunctional [glutamate--ammonia ligase]-adenylyl-L-tyrosine phosphorylase/[glutamate--ammonia-ligase] adenylyltransferase [Solimonas marina]|uniref:Bifunctional glutamine synthetase adenylyltransferase/adenylyl-removing enzyme n=1 Tax=Solimonas marina TaxID=2714601 RepID=A0A969WB44_9GAMM|nr:bifunctional [glutamate--ammonia ligase]-adenylyl-L-tyrosine phosphorylase/[glutamate--ammonia-ligase] adenylyltransferase [Solimonas marina]NKF21645.1 bifunctional [glutamate--ammonia ligase]-adenylyl-L-tyrosine phosphorylase/[glutamate--ammonia-ligase] adenylyltransferase [Solimonas marina]
MYGDLSPEALCERFAARCPPLAAVAPRVFRASPFTADAFARVLDAPDAFVTLDTAYAPSQMAQRVAAATQPAADDATLMRALRVVRRDEMARIAFRDLAELAPLDETLGDLSDLADACLAAALAGAEARLQQRYGVPRDDDGALVRPLVLGMGKLGGRELNFSSDIDLIFCHGAAGQTDGTRTLSNEEYFVRLAQDVQRSLASVTVDGFVFRVDLMLRPFGSAGALSVSYAAFEEYYQSHGREWERYALIKARPVAGDLDGGHALLRALRPFVYRRYLDYNAIGNLRDLKRLIAEDVARRGAEDNVKLGSGGIRELEFIVQSFQLVRGGAEAPLRDSRLRPVLRYLGSAGHLQPDVAQRLDDAYVFLRRLENAIQMYGDQQTHALPTAEVPRAALCAALDIEDWSQLAARITKVRSFVEQQFEAVFSERGSAGSEAASEDSKLARALWHGMASGDEAVSALREAGFGEAPEALAGVIDELRNTRLVRALSERSTTMMVALLAALFELARQQEQPEAALMRTLRVLQAIGGRSTYLALLHDNVEPREQLMRLCAASPWLTDFIAQSPVLLDSLLDRRALYDPPTRESLRDELTRRIAEVPDGDTEAGMDLLRRYQKEMTLRIAAADLSGVLPLVQVSDRLTWLAESLVDAALTLAWREMLAQYGGPQRSDGSAAGFAVIAYGKFGGIELGYGSDLDLVFLHDCDQLDADTEDGPRAINNGVFYARLAQRVINWLATQTPAGRAYEVDMELRPNGRSGLLVSSLDSFADYQRESAWTWEHQALTRARCVAGPAWLVADFAALRREILVRRRDPQKLAHDIVEMRAKMRASLDRSDAELWDIKQGEGGLIDIEFVTQYLVLRDAHCDAGIVQWSDNWRQLEALAAAGALDAQSCETLIACYRSYRAWAHNRSLQNAPQRAPYPRFEKERAAVREVVARYL